MKDSYIDKNYLLDHFYRNPSGLKTRINTWKKHGTNKVSLYEWIVKDVVNRHAETYLDAGCGNGELIRHFAKYEKAKSIFGIDISDSMINEALKKLKSYKNCKLKVSDIEKTDFSEFMFDLVTCSHVLYHVKNIHSTLLELKRITNREGTLVIVTSNYDLNQGLNKVHYDGLKKFDFPNYMQDTEIYTRFSGDNSRKIINDLFGSYFEFKYKNNLRFKEINPVLEYYTSAMMFRNSYGINDPNISKSKFLALLNYVKEKVALEIKHNGYFESFGEVSAFKIYPHLPIKPKFDELFSLHRKNNASLNPVSAKIEVLSSIDFPSELDNSNQEQFCREIDRCGYDGVNLGLTPLHEDAKRKDVKNTLNKSGIRINSYHGSSLKNEISKRKKYKYFLEKDLESCNALNDGKPASINYDLFTGKMVKPSKNMNLTKNQNIHLICKTIQISLGEFEIYRYIIDSISKVYSKTQHKIYFEIPGTLGWSMMPKPDIKTISRIISLIDSIFPEASLCIDLGHLVTWYDLSEKKDLNKVKKLLSNISKNIGMIHISSAGTNNKLFHSLMSKNYGDLPDWHTFGLDLMLPIDSQHMVELIEYIRLLKKGDNLIEICESRYYGKSVKDYFEGMNYNFTDISNYYYELKNQAIALGYTHGRNKKN